MAAIIYFSMAGMVIFAGFAYLGVVLYLWLKKKEEEGTKPNQP